MAAPLPNGLDLRVMPMAPQVDAQAFAPDYLKALTSAQVGLAVGNELANVAKVRSDRELALAKNKAEKAQIDLHMKELDATAQAMSDPKFAEALKEAAMTNVLGAAVKSRNALSTATADQQFAGDPSIVQAALGAQLQAGAQYLMDPTQILNPQAGAGSRSLAEAIAAAPGNQAKVLLAGQEARQASDIRQNEQRALADLGTEKDLRTQLQNVGVPESSYSNPDGSFNREKAQQIRDQAREQYPRPFIEQQDERAVLDRATAVKSLSSFLEDVPKLIKSLGNTSTFQNIAASMRDTTGRGLIGTALSNSSAKLMTPETAQKKAVIDYINAKRQEAFNTGALGREMKNNEPLVITDSNETLLKVAKEVQSQLDREYDSLKNGRQPWMFKAIDDKYSAPEGPQSVSSAARRASSLQAPAATPQDTPKQRFISPDGKAFLIYRKNGQLFREPTQ